MTIDKLERQTSSELNELDKKLDSKLNNIEEEIAKIKVSQAVLSNDIFWIKWLLGSLLSFKFRFNFTFCLCHFSCLIFLRNTEST